MFDRTLIDRLPSVQGSYESNVSMASMSWFRTGGPAEVVYKPTDPADLQVFLQNLPKDIPYRIIGIGSNLLVRDGGLPGVTIRLSKSGFTFVKIEGQKLTTGTGTLDAMVAKHAQRAGLTGLEFYIGIPGTIGGALKMNAGAHHGETVQYLRHVKALDPQGQFHTLSPEELGHSYRSSALKEGWITCEATFELKKDDPTQIQERMKKITQQRIEAQPIKERTGGSTFKNPPEGKSWQLIDEAGCRGLTVGDAMMSEMHCNFLINKGNATAEDIETLGEEVRRRVKEKTGISLNWEIRRIGLTKQEASEL